MKTTDEGLRTLVNDVEGEVAHLQTLPAQTDVIAPLTKSWAALVRGLDLGPAPDLIACANCGKKIMREATICGYCWTSRRERAVQ